MLRLERLSESLAVGNNRTRGNRNGNSFRSLVISASQHVADGSRVTMQDGFAKLLLGGTGMDGLAGLERVKTTPQLLDIRAQFDKSPDTGGDQRCELFG